MAAAQLSAAAVEAGAFAPADLGVTIGPVASTGPVDTTSPAAAWTAWEGWRSHLNRGWLDQHQRLQNARSALQGLTK